MSGQTCWGCGLETRRSYGGWPDRHPWVASTLAALARFADLSEQHPTAAMALVVPGTLIGFAAIATYPFVFVPLVLLLGVAFVASIANEGARRNPACWREDCPVMTPKA